MKYSYKCITCGPFEIDRRMGEMPTLATCPTCGQESRRDFKADLVPVHYNAQGFERTDNFKGNVGGGTADKLEWLNSNWSKYYGEKPPKADSKGTYDGT